MLTKRITQTVASLLVLVLGCADAGRADHHDRRRRRMALDWGVSPAGRPATTAAAVRLADLFWLALMDGNVAVVAVACWLALRGRYSILLDVFASSSAC
jgi:hypothetical protein